QNVTYRDGRAEQVIRQREIRRGGPTTFQPKREVEIKVVEETVDVLIEHPLGMAFVEMPTTDRPALGRPFSETVYAKGEYETRDGLGRPQVISAFTLSSEVAMAYLKLLEADPVDLSADEARGFSE